MNCDTGFCCGIGVGLAAGITVGMMMSSGKKAMKTQVGKNIEKMGVAVDRTMDHIISNLR